MHKHKHGHNQHHQQNRPGPLAALIGAASEERARRQKDHDELVKMKARQEMQQEEALGEFVSDLVGLFAPRRDYRREAEQANRERARLAREAEQARAERDRLAREAEIARAERIRLSEQTRVANLPKLPQPGLLQQFVTWASTPAPETDEQRMARERKERIALQRNRDIANQANIHKLIANCRNFVLNHGDLPNGLKALEQALSLANTIYPENIEASQYTPPTYFSASLDILRFENEQYLARSQREATSIASKWIDSVMWRISPLQGSACLYANHLKYLEAALNQSLIANWYKFDRREPSLEIAFQDKLMNLILANVKSIGWIRWFKDRSKSNSLVSETNAHGTKQYPVLTAIWAEMNDYKPNTRVNLGFSLPIFPESIPVAHEVAGTVYEGEKLASAPPVQPLVLF